MQIDFLAAEQRNFELEQKVLENSKLKEDFGQLEESYSTVLELLGEKEEQILEMKADIEDMKSAFRADMSLKYS